MLQMEEAIKILQEQVHPITETEQLPLPEGIGRILAEEGRAQADQPPFPRSPLDGYAVRGKDTEGAEAGRPVRLKVVGSVYAGEAFPGRVQEGEAVRIMTGAPIPQGADTVIRQEDSDRGREWVMLYRGSKPYENYCFQGEDYRKGEVLLRKGTVLGGYETALAASLGMSRVTVYQRPAVAVISTGDELIPPGDGLGPGKIYDSNLQLVSGRLTELGAPPAAAVHCRDDAGRMAAQIKELSGRAKLIITTGGVSVGEKDIMHDVISLLSARELFWRVAVKPGAPTLAAMFQDTLLICLSGNPFGAAANFELLVRPVIGAMTGDKRWLMKERAVRIEQDYHKPAGARRFLRGFCEGEKARLLPGNQASGSLSAMLGCNCLIEIPAGQAGARAGDWVKAYLL